MPWGTLANQTDEEEVAHCERDMEIAIKQDMQADKVARLKALEKANMQEHQCELERQEREQKGAEEKHHLAKEGAVRECQLKAERKCQMILCMEQEKFEQLEHEQDIRNAQEASKALNIKFSEVTSSAVQRLLQGQNLLERRKVPSDVILSEEEDAQC